MKLLSIYTLKNLFRLAIAGSGGALLVAASLYLYLSPKLPTIEALKEVKLQVPLRIYSQDLQLLGEYGEKRRSPIPFEEIPQQFIQALLAAEDARFYDHNGVDFVGLMRAASQLVSSGKIQGGGSTITMQVARNFFLSFEQTFTRKFNEILLSFRIEDSLSKNEILTLYANKIYLGKRAYGIGAASQVYYGRDIGELTLPELAMIAGLPKAPSSYNPINRPERALIRRNWILGRMQQLEMIDANTYQESINAPITASYHGYNADLDAPYISEMARTEGIKLLGKDLYTGGYRIFTTVESSLQRSAQTAVRNGLIAYDWRHGYRGPERHIENKDSWSAELSVTGTYARMEPVIVTEVAEQQLELLRKDGSTTTLLWENGLKGLRSYLDESHTTSAIKTADKIFSIGDLIRIRPKGNGEWSLSQVPVAQAAIVALDPNNGAIRSLVGGFDYYLNKFNRITQANRQPGSNFKPFVYTAALESGLTAATTISGAPITIKDAALEGYWRPENDAGRVYGPTRIRKGLYKSLNTVSVRLLRTVGIKNVINGMSRFGFKESALPRNSTLTLGSHAVPPMTIARGYTAFANGGYKVSPYLIDRIEDVNGNIIHQALPDTVCRDCDKNQLDDTTLTAEQSISETGYAELATEELDLEDLNSELTLKAPEDNLNTQSLEDEISETEDDIIAPTLEYPAAERIMDERVAYIMDSILKDVIKKGTGRKARSLNRNDIAGKTGTTNEARDAWFSGYQPSIVATAWVGFDNNTPLGRKEYGGSAALPIWIEFMKTALNNVPEMLPPLPDNLVMVRIDPDNGERVGPERTDAPFEYFRNEYLPKEPVTAGERDTSKQAVPDDLF